MSRPSWLRRALRLAFNRCPWCGEKLEEAVLHNGPYRMRAESCPDGHYLRWTDFVHEAAYCVLENEGRVVAFRSVYPSGAADDGR